MAADVNYVSPASILFWQQPVSARTQSIEQQTQAMKTVKSLLQLIAAVILIHRCAYSIPLDDFYTFGASAVDGSNRLLHTRTKIS